MQLSKKIFPPLPIKQSSISIQSIVDIYKLTKLSPSAIIGTTYEGGRITMVAFKNQIRIGDAIIPTLEASPLDPTKAQAIFFDNETKRYYFSNNLGHKVISGGTERPMTKKEYKDTCQKMTSYALETNNETLLDEIIKLDFKLGHANSTFEISKSYQCTSLTGTLIFNQGLARYIYNPDSDSVFHINHSKQINGTFLTNGPEKEAIVKTLTTSKTMQKKLQSTN